MNMLTDDAIERAKKRIRHSHPDGVHHEHRDCVRLAYEWLDAQLKLAEPSRRNTYPLAHIISHWAGRSVSVADVEVAAELNPEITGRYPHFNIAARLTMPHHRRLVGIGQARTQDHNDGCERYYKITEK
jgi:hypothetical protein